MSHDPFDGVLLDDPRPAVPGAVGMLLHLQVARRRAASRGWPRPTLEGVRARAQACRELLAHGLLPATLRGLQAQGLDLGGPEAPRSLASLADHLEAYLQAVDQAGFLEPDAALWRAVDLELAGQRGLWIERTPADGPLAAGLRDLAPARLRALACVPGLGGAVFSLATRKGGAASGLFGSPLPLVAWCLDGLEAHGQHLPNELVLAEPDGWGTAPWTPALEGLFEAPLALDDHAGTFQRGLVEGPIDLLRHAVEQLCAWVDGGIPPAEISVIHPEPQAVAPFLAPLLAAEGLALQVRGGLLPLGSSEAWSPLWTLLKGLQRLDPCAVSAGLRASRREDLRRWAEALAQADQTGPPAFEGSFLPLGDGAAAARSLWQGLWGLRGSTLAAQQWAGRLEGLAAALRLPTESDDFYAPLGLLKEAWGRESWTFGDMLTALEAFLDAARSGEAPRAADGVRLLGPSGLLDDWEGARATLLLDLSEGAWPSRPLDNPDLDADRKAALNRALLAATLAGPEAPFPPALQRFWLPRSEHGEPTPRAFQREAYALNKVLAMTTERLVALSPAQDAEGRARGQGPFWEALAGAAAWQVDPGQAHSRLRARWEARTPDLRRQARAEAVQARPAEAGLGAEAPPLDRAPGHRDAWLKGQPAASPTALEALATCPFRSLAERVWGLEVQDPGARLAMAVGSLVHRLMEALLRPLVGEPDWPAAFRAALGLDAHAVPEDLLPHVQAAWMAHHADWLADLRHVLPQEQAPQAVLRVEALLPGVAAALLRDAQAEGPEPEELALLEAEGGGFPGAGPAAWQRTLLLLEEDLGPVDLDLGGGRTLPVRGKVDRLERWVGGNRAFLRVVDYKTSRTTSLRAYAEAGAPFGTHLQTPLYLLLAEHVHPGTQATAVLLPLREEVPKPFARHLALLAAEGPGGAWRLRLLGSLARLDARLEEGDFPPTPGEHCTHCQLAALCGRPVDVTVDAAAEGD